MLFKSVDVYGNHANITSDKIRHVLNLLDDYMNGTEYCIREAWMDNIKDKNKRIDVEIFYINMDGILIQQKLLIMNDEVIDGKTFHERYAKWYGKEDVK